VGRCPKVEVFTGAGIPALGFFTPLCFTAGLVAAPRAEGTVAPRGGRAALRGKPAGMANKPVELQALVTRLALALEERAPSTGGGGTASQPSQQVRKAP
jgi:hypothetical protein